MTVVDVVRKYELEDYEKHYGNQYGNFCNLIPLDKLAGMEVKGIRINFPTREVTITIIQHEEIAE